MKNVRIVVVVAAVTGLAGTVALASEHGEHREREHREREDRGAEGERGQRRVLAPADAAGRTLYRKECGACHLAFPPGLLPAESHRRTLAGLERHFGQNAELEPEVRARLEGYLVANAAEAGTLSKSRKLLASAGGGAPLRITELPYFRRKHRGVDAATVARPTIRSLANCAACHPAALDGDYEDDRVRIPGR